jgi:hypothetical protein
LQDGRKLETSMLRHRPQQGQRTITGQHLFYQHRGLVPLNVLHIGRQLVNRQASLDDGRAYAAQPQVLQLPDGQAHAVSDLGSVKPGDRCWGGTGVVVLHAPMKTLFANKAKSMLHKCAPPTTKDPASTTCQGWQMMKTGSSGV